MRPIRSFVRRTGRVTPAQKQALQNYFPKYGLTLDQGLLNFQELWHNASPIVLEIGFGMGDSLIQQAIQNPEKNYLGIDVYDAGVGATLAAIEKHALTNVRLFYADAVDVLSCCIPDNSISLIQIFFPDPWPKNRHHKRRLIQTEFVKSLRKKLILHGKLHLATDWKNYAEHMLTVVETILSPSSIPQFQQRANSDTQQHQRPLTKFEIRGQKLGHQIFDLVFTKEAVQDLYEEK